MTNQPKPKRRLLQFSLRGLIFFCAVVCVWLGFWINAAREQEKIVAWVVDNEGWMHYEYEFNDDGWYINEAKDQPTWKYIPIPISWQSWLGKDFEWNVVHVHFYESSNVADLTPLKKLYHLKWLDLRKSQVSDLSPLKDLKNLKSLNLDGCPILDLTPLKGLKGLEKLDLEQTKVTEEEISDLQKSLPNCKIEHNFE